MYLTGLVVLVGFLLDLILGDPPWMPHPVRVVGWLISKGEKIIRKISKKSPRSEWVGGAALTFVVVGVTGGAAWGLVWLAGEIHPLLGLVVEVWLTYQILATKSLKTESMKVYKHLTEGNLVQARHSLSMIVGRDTAELNEREVAKGAVETVAENTSDGIIAPLFYMALGGPVLGMCYKAVNTLDSMIGYKNEKYLYLGRVAAKLDDWVNYIPARLSAWFMMAGAFFLRLNVKEAYRIYRRDRYNHSSPNSAHTEAVCAGALGIRLGGDGYYFGKLVSKPVIGDQRRNIEAEDIAVANRLLYRTAFVGVVVLVAARTALIWAMGG